MIHHLLFLADLDPGLWMSGLQSFNPETDTAMLDCELLWFMGGFLFAFIMGAFCMIIRAVKGAGGGSIDL
jgi:hypothetical protein